MIDKLFSTHTKASTFWVGFLIGMGFGGMLFALMFIIQFLMRVS